MTGTNNTTTSKISQQFKDQIKGKVTCKSSGDLMTNFIAGTAINAENEIDVIQDSNGDPILFSISTPINTTDGTNVNQLFMTYRDTCVGTGWHQVNISPVTNSSMHIFGVSQDPTTGDFVLAVAVEGLDSSGQSTDTVYITDSISSDTSKWDWSDAASNWTVRNGTPNGATVQKIMVGQNSKVSNIPLIIANVQVGGAAKHYFIQGDPTKTNFSEYNSASTNTWSEYQMPAGATEILDLSIGTMYLHKRNRLGTYALYNVDTELCLTFTSVPDLLLKSSYDLQLMPPAGTVAIQALPDQSENDVSILFAAGNGLYIFESTNQLSAVTDNVAATATLISDISAFSNISQLIARQDSSHISIWVRDKEILWYVRGTQNASARDWTVPLSLSQNVARIAAIRNQPKDANAIIVAGSNGKTMSYMWQDNQTTLWKQTDMPLPTLDSVQEFSCYTTVLSFTDENDNPVVGQDVGINASEWTYATVNGYYKSLDNDTANPVRVKTDSQGKVTIINKVINASTPAFWATSDFLETQYTAHPATNVLNGFKGITSAQDLLNAKTQTGNYIIPEDLRGDTNTLDSIANGISQIMGTVNKLPSDGSPYTAAPSGSANALVAENQTGQIWGMSFNRGSATFQIGDNAKQLFQQLGNNSFATPETNSLGTDIESDIEQAFVWAGDALQSMWSDVTDVVKFVVDTTKDVIDGVANIIVQIGTQVVSFVIKTISDVLSFVSWLLKTIKVGIETLIEWLGFIFEWDDILATHNFFKFMSNQTLDYFGAVIKSAEKPITDLFDNLIDKVNKMPAFEIPGKSDVNLLAAIPSQTQKLTSAGQTDLRNILTNPGFNFTTYQTEHGGVSGAVQYVSGGNVPTTVDLSNNTFLDQLEQVLKDILKTLKDGLKSFEQVFKDIGTLIQNNELTLGNLAKVISKDVIIGVLTFAKDLMITFIDLAELMIELIITTINSKINIPFVSGLYSKITDGNDFTLLDSFALLGAIPTTIGYKLLTGETPFKKGSGGNETITYEQIFPIPFFPNLPQPETQSLMAMASAENDTESSDPDILASRVYSLAGGILGTISGAISVVSSYVEYGVDEEAKAKWANVVSGLSYTDLLFSILTVASTFPVAGGDSERDKIENGIDYPIWFLELIDVVINSIVPAFKAQFFLDKAAGKFTKEVEEDIGKRLKSLEEKTMTPLKAGYQMGAGAIDLVLNFISLGVEMIDNDEFDGWDGAKQIQNLCASAGLTMTGVTGVGMMSSEKTDDEYELLATGLAFVVSLFLNGGATAICLVRTVDTAVVDTEDKLEYR